MNLLEKYLNNNITYLDEYGYNTKTIEDINFNHETKDIQELYYDMFNKFIQPLMDKLKKYDEDVRDQTIFNFFLTDDENNVYGVMYDTGIEFLITDNEIEYNKTINKVFNEILTFY